MRNGLVIAALLVLHGGSVSMAQEKAATSTSNGVFTEEQAKKGEGAYRGQCASCHGSDLHSTDSEAPDLTEGAFKFGWNGKTIAERFEAIRSSMPPGKARSLDDQTYIDILAYVLHFNGIPSGNQKLEPDLKKLEQIVISTSPG